MSELTLRRVVTLVAAAWLGLVLTASVEAVLPLSWGARVAPPDLALLLVLFVGLEKRGGPVGGCALAVTLGYLADLSGGCPKGLHMIAYGALFLAARASSTRLLVRGALLTALVALVFAGGAGLLVAALRASFEPGAGLGALRQVPIATITTALFAPPWFAALARLDRRYVRQPGVLVGALR